MIGKKINQLATELAPDSTDLTIIGDPISGVSKKITLAQLGAIFSGAVSFFANFASFPATGDINVIYCAKDTQKLYLWSGSAYVEVFPSQALLNTYQLRSEKGVSNGYASLDSGGKVPISQLPSSIMEYKGTWNASTNTPTLANGTGDTGDVYICNVAGTVNFGAGPLTFAVGDYVIYSGTIWQRSSGAVGTVTSVAITESGDSLNITGSPITTSGTINIGFNGTNLQYVNGAGNLTTFPTLITSIGLSMPSAFSVANSPLTANGTIAVTGAGVASQYIRGDGTLASFPTGGGGGSSVSYYLNGGTNQGTFVGNTYYEMSKNAVIGTGVDFTINANGYISQFITDANDPAQLVIPAGNWNFEMYFSASSGGGSPSFYVELYKYNGSTFTLIADNSANPEYITNGTAIDLYTTAVAVPETSLTITDRLAIRVYVTHASKTITLHTQNSHLCQVITTFSTGITALNGLTAQVQYFQTGTSGTDFNIASSTATHTFNLPTASATNRGALSSADWTTFNSKQNALTNPVTGTGASGQVTFFNGTSTVTGTNNFFWDATNNRLGIGTTTPQRSIEIFNSTADNHLRLSGNAPSVSMGEAVTGSIYQAKFGLVTVNGQFVTAGVAGDFVIISQTGATIIGTSSTEKMRVQSSGNVSINNTNDTYKLDVTGTGRFTGQLRLESTITDGTNTYTLPSATGTLALTSALSGMITGSGTTNYLPKFTGASTIGNSSISDNGTGRVSIGTTSFNDSFVISNSGAAGWEFANTGSVITYNRSTSAYIPMTFQASSFGFTGAATFSSTVLLYDELRIRNTSYGASYNTSLRSISGAVGVLQLGNNDTNYILAGNTAAGGYLIFRVNCASESITAGSEAMRITASGNLSIGNTNDSYKLDVQGAGIFRKVNGDSRIIAYQTGTAPYTATLELSSQTLGTYGGVVQYDGLDEKLTIENYGRTASGTQQGDINFRTKVGNTTPTNVLNLDGFTGAATFSSSVTANNNISAIRVGSSVTTLGQSRYLDLSDYYGNTNARMEIGLGYSAATGITNIPAIIGYLQTSTSGYTYGDIYFATRSVTTDTAPTERMRITSGGNVGINTSSPSYTLDVNGTARFGSAIVASLGTGLVYSSGGTLTSTNPSDQRLKNNIQSISYGLDEILKLNPVTFNWIEDKINQGKQYGFIAQEVQKIMPDLVKNLGIKDYLGLDKEAIFTILVRAIQQLNDKIK